MLGSRNASARPHRPSVALLATALASVALVATPAPSAHAANTSGGAPVPPGGVALTWTPEYMSDNHDYTQAEAVDLARRFDLVAAMPYAFRGEVGAMRQANPRLNLLAYANATLATAGSAAGLPEASFAHDTSGRRITAPGFGTYLMESSNARWRSEANAQCDQRSALGGYDGCLVDMLTLGVFSRGYVTALPVNPATGREYTQPEYRTQMTSLAAYYRSHSPGLAHVGNSVENAYRYWQSKDAPSRPLANSQPAAQMEDFLRGSGSAVTAFPSAADWLRNVDVVRDMEAQGTVGLFTTKLWVGATAAQVKRWQAYAMATFLMGAGGHSYLAFTRSRDKAGVKGATLPYVMPKSIGTPSGAMRQLSSGAWTRDFSNGMSVVNPTGAAVTVPLGQSMRTLDGATVSSLTLPAASGQVLLRTSTSSPSSPAVDTTAPTVTIGTAGATGSTVRLTGTASDDVRLAGVRYAVRDETSKQWLQAAGGWGGYHQLSASVASSTSASTTWSLSRSLLPGRYGISVLGIDGAGNVTANRPWRVVTVS